MKFSTLSLLGTTALATSAGAMTTAPFTEQPGSVTDGSITLFSTLGNSTGPARILLPKFDTMGGTRILTGATVTTGGSISGEITAENADPTFNEATAVLDGGLQFFFDNGDLMFNAADDGPANLIQIVEDTSNVEFLEAADGTRGSGNDFNDFGRLSSIDADTTVSVPTADLGLYSSVDGSGDIAIFFEATSGFNVEFEGNGFGNIDNLEVQTDSFIIYTFETVPEPSSTVMVMLAALSSTFIRRRS